MSAWSYQFAMPRVHFGAGRLGEAPLMAAEFGSRALVVTGGRSFRESEAFDPFFESLREAGLDPQCVSIAGEPSPRDVDEAAAEHAHCDVVIAVGGGAVVDAGKAVAAMLPLHRRGENASVREYLEGVGTRTHPGDKAPYLAVPTTAGTGAEASKNAVISEVGPAGFKKSLRHDRFIPDAVLLDPTLHVTCPPDVTAACGMDALTQLLESFVSPKATPMTDALAWSGLEALAGSLLHVCGAGADDVAARGRMAYAAFCSGVTLAHAGLGIVHGLAGPIGGYFEAPHGAVCGTLLAAAVRANVAKLRPADADAIARAKHARVGRLLSKRSDLDDVAALDALEDTLGAWTRRLNIPTLDAFGVSLNDIVKITAAAGLKQNPVDLGEAEIQAILASRMA